MKKATLLIVLILISTIGFSQNKIGGDDPISGIDIIIKKNPGSKPIVNTGNNPLIDEINKLEFQYLNLKANEIHDSFKTEFYRIEGHQGKEFKSENDVFKAYISYLKKRISKQSGVIEKQVKSTGLSKTERRQKIKNRTRN